MQHLDEWFKILSVSQRKAIHNRSVQRLIHPFLRWTSRAMWIVGSLAFLECCASSLSSGHVSSQSPIPTDSLESSRDIAQTSDRLGVIEIANPSKFSRIGVLSDVHGMYEELVTVLKAAQVIDSDRHWIGGKSLVVVVGDSIDKGPKSVEVLDLWIELAEKSQLTGGRVIHLLGNHEAEFLADPSNRKAAELIAELRSRNIALSDLTSSSTPRGAFLHSEPVALRLGRWVFAHSGFLPQSLSWREFTERADQVIQSQHYEVPFLIGDDSVLETKGWWKNPDDVGDYLKRLDGDKIFGIVFGHQPKAFGVEGQPFLTAGGRILKIDSGMEPEAGSHPGVWVEFPNPAQLMTGLAQVEILDTKTTLRRRALVSQPLPRTSASLK